MYMDANSVKNLLPNIKYEHFSSINMSVILQPRTPRSHLNTPVHLNSWDNRFSSFSLPLPWILSSASSSPLFSTPPFTLSPLCSHLYWWSESGRYPSGPLTQPSNASVPMNNAGPERAKFVHEQWLCVGKLSVHPCVLVLIMHITSASTWRICKEIQLHFCTPAHCVCTFKNAKSLCSRVRIFVGH